MGPRTIAAGLAMLTLLRSVSALAAEPAEPVAATDVAGGTDSVGGDGEAGATDGGDVVGVALMIIGAGAAGVGATLLVIEASSDEASRDEAGADAGLEGVRGRSAQETEGDGEVLPAVGVGLLVGGAVVHLIGVIIAFGGHDGDETRPAATARIEPLVGPTFTGVRGAF